MELNDRYSKSVSYRSTSQYESLYTAHLLQEDDPNEYIRCQFVSVRFKCELSSYKRRLSFKHSDIHHDELGNEFDIGATYQKSSSLELSAYVCKENTGWHSFSFFGKNNEVQPTIKLFVSKGDEEEGATIFGFEEHHDMDIQTEESLTLCIGLPQDRFEEYLAALLDGSCDLYVDIRLDKCAQLFSTWSPSVSEGRKIKYLSAGKADELMATYEIPEDFYSSEIRSIDYSLTLDRNVSEEILEHNKTIEDVLEKDKWPPPMVDTASFEVNRPTEKLHASESASCENHSLKIAQLRSEKLRWQLISYLAISYVLFTVFFMN